jgi:hypothetical protein
VLGGRKLGGLCFPSKEDLYESIFQKRAKGWRYDFTLNGTRFTEAWFKTKQEARKAEMTRKEEIERQEQAPGTPTDISFLELVNARLDYVKNHKSERHFGNMSTWQNGG